MTGNTSTLDPISLIVSQLEVISQDIKALPLLVARLEALTELTRQMENTWRESASEFRERGAQQQEQIQELLLHKHMLDSSLEIQISRLDELQRRVEMFDPGARQKLSDIHERLERGDKVFVMWRPWLATIKWVTVAAGAVVVAVVVSAAIWMLGNYLAQGGVP